MFESRLRRIALVVMFAAPLGGSLVGCNATAPKAEDRDAVLAESANLRNEFEASVPGLNNQIAQAPAYVVFPDIGQAGFIIGGQGGRGAVYRGSGQHIGWATINTANIGLQAGVQNYSMLMVFKDQATLDKFRANELTGNANSVAVIGDEGGSQLDKFDNGVASYHKTRGGLMAGLQLGLDSIKYAPEFPGDPR